MKPLIKIVGKKILYKFSESGFYRFPKESKDKINKNKTNKR
jgi:hypothetical protein